MLKIWTKVKGESKHSVLQFVQKELEIQVDVKDLIIPL
jgi:hypothetical protein